MSQTPHEGWLSAGIAEDKDRKTVQEARKAKQQNNQGESVNGKKSADPMEQMLQAAAQAEQAIKNIQQKGELVRAFTEDPVKMKQFARIIDYVDNLIAAEQKLSEGELSFSEKTEILVKM